MSIQSLIAKELFTEADKRLKTEDSELNRYLALKSKVKQMNYQQAYEQLAEFHTESTNLQCSVLYQISQLQAECLLIEKAFQTVGKCLVLAESDTLLLLKARIMAKVRLQKKTGFFVEALQELDSVETELCSFIEAHADN